MSALLLMGTLAVGGGAYALMPREQLRAAAERAHSRRCCKATPNARRADLHPAAAMAAAVADVARAAAFTAADSSLEPFVLGDVIGFRVHT